MSETTQTIIILNEVLDVVRQRYLASLRHPGWHFVRVWPNGNISSGLEVSRCIPESEYYRTGSPHPVTVYEVISQDSFDEDEIESEAALIDQSSFDEEGIRDKLIEAGYLCE